jgi:predicted DNA-binding mobile mystery protein A
MGVAPSRIPVIERAEITGATTLKTLRQAATAMNCTFVYAFVPIDSLDDIVRNRAVQKARKDGARLAHTMRLANQAVLQSDLDAEWQRSINRILTGSLRGLWDEDRDLGG